MPGLRDPRDVRAFARFLAVVLAVVVASVAILAATVARPLPGPSPLRVESVTVEPSSPQPGVVATVRARVVSGVVPTVVLGFGVQFVDVQAGTVLMQPEGGGNEYAARLGPFGSGAEVWLFVAAALPNRGPVRSNFTFFQVGPVLRDFARLHVVSVVHDPAEPFSFQTVNFLAQITSTAGIRAVTLTYVRVGRQSTDGGPLSMAPMDSSSSYIASMPAIQQFDREALVAYRVAVTDANNYTAVSAIGEFTVRFPQPVP